MNKLFVGQRVRVAWVHDARNAYLVGSEGRITEIDDHPIGPTIFALDSCPFERDETNIYGFFAEQLEPILPEGHAPSIYSYEELMDKCRSGVVV